MALGMPTKHNKQMLLKCFKNTPMNVAALKPSIIIINDRNCQHATSKGEPQVLTIRLRLFNPLCFSLTAKPISLQTISCKLFV